MTTESRGRVLCSPTFLSALFVLIANDRWLKGAGLFPTWLTGKLSDFAGLIVAPLLLVVLVRARTRGAQLACFAAVSFIFAALELSPELARGVEQVTRRVALNWRLWPDPTDLLALAMLPVGWRALRAAPGSTGTATSFDKVVAGVAALACLGTSSAVSEHTTAVALFNTTREEVHLQLFRAGPIDCALLAKSPEEALTPRAFSLEACLNAKPFIPVPLDADWSAPHEVGETPPALDRKCDAVLVRAPGLPETVLFWNDAPKGEVLVRSTGGAPEGAEYLAFVENIGRALVLSPPAAIHSFVTDAGPPAAECPAEEP